MGAQGTAVLDFGVFPGSSDAVVDVAAPGVVASSLIEAWMNPSATADHTVDEHMVETIQVTACYLSDGNIRIRGVNTSQLVPPLLPEVVQHPGNAINQGPVNMFQVRKAMPMLVGQFSVAWVWN